MELGQFSLSLTVKNIAASKKFYEKMGFSALEGCGGIEEKWLIMQHDSVVIGLFEGMFDNNIITFNPNDVRSIEKTLTENGVEMETSTKGDSGPAHCVFRDPDGNVIMLDQHQ